MKIRPACVEDADAMGKCLVETWLATHRGNMSEAAWQKRRDEWTAEVSARGWREVLQEIEAEPDCQMCIFVAEDEAGSVVGLVMGRPAEDYEATGEISVIYVHQSHQGRGLGRRLVSAVAAQLQEMGFSALHIGVLAANAPARAFYERLGGRVVFERDFDEDGEKLLEVVYGWNDIGAVVE